MLEIAEKTGMDKIFKVELIHAMCLKYIQDKMPGIDPDKANTLAKIKAESLIYSRITHSKLDEVIDQLKGERSN